MQTTRRIYLYVVSAISLTAVTWSVILLFRLILSEEIGQGQIIELASLLAVIIVGLPIFIFHWLMAQRLAAKDEAERATITRRIYFGVMMAIGTIPIISNVYRLVDNALLALLDGTRQDFYPYDLTIAEHLVALIAWGLVWVYLWRQIQADNRRVAPRDDHLGIRRLYLFIFAQAGLVMAGLGAIGLLQTLLETLATSVNWRTAAANSSAQLLVGCAVWIGHWLPVQSSFFAGDPTEERSVLRKIYLYLNVLVFSVMTVVSASVILTRFIELALGAPPAEEPLLSQLSGPIPLVIVGGVLWAYHWYVLGQDATEAPETPRQATIRRIYGYLVAAIGLTVLLSGIVGILSVLIDLLTTPASVGLSYYRGQVAVFTAMIVVGGPVWLLPWRKLQGVALTAPDADAAESGAAEARRATTRKIYLYFFLLLAALAFFGSLGWFVFHILTALLGAELPDDFITLVLDALVIALLAAGVWLYHWQAIQRDGQLEKIDQANRLADISVVVIDGQQGELGRVVINGLQHDLPGIQIKPVGLTPEAVAAIDGQPLTAEVLDNAQFIVGDWQNLGSPATIADSPALKLAIPTTKPNWVWAGVKPQRMDHYAEQVVQEIKHFLEGDSRQDVHPALVVVAVIGSIVGFLILAGGVIAIIDSLL